MNLLLKVFFILLIADSPMVNFRVISRTMATIAEAFKVNGVVPDVVPKAPARCFMVRYRSGAKVKEGNELTPTQVKDMPEVTWGAKEDKFYTLAMTDPDAPSREEPKFREFDHWLVGNIPGPKVDAGETLTEYVGPSPPANTGLHRYVFLVYEQPSKLTFDEQRLTNSSDDLREGFSIYKFAQKYELGDPCFGNFFQAKYDDSVGN